jgi:hypothetical protein
MNTFAYNSTGNDLLKAAESILQGSLCEADDFYAEEMIKNQLQTIVRNSSECIDMIERGLKFPEWAQSKIAVAEDGIVSVTEFMQSHYANKAKLEEAARSSATKSILDSIDNFSKEEFKQFLLAFADHMEETSKYARKNTGASAESIKAVSKYLYSAAEAFKF